jgi:hypothetical protein
MRHPRATAPAFVACLLGLVGTTPAADRPEPVVLNDDASWCWFQDERALVTGGRLVFGSVAAGRSDSSRRGAVEATSLELATGGTSRFRLSATPVERAGRYDDHDTPAFVVRGDGRVLAGWTGHGFDSRILTRVTLDPGDTTRWSDERTFVPSPSSKVSYTNLFRLDGEAGRVYDFFRGLDDRFKPSFAFSDDGGGHWTTGGVVIDVPAAFRHRPYAKYASDGRGTIHIVYTEGHPRDYDNSLYHVYYREGMLHRSDGSVIRSLAQGLREPAEGTRIFQGDPQNVAWVSDVELDAQGRPFVAYSIQKDSAGLPPGQGGSDHRYRLAHWNGKAWEDHALAYAGTRLYAGEDDYTGLVALAPGDATRVYLSTNADPRSGTPLVSRADGQRHWEIFSGETRDGGQSFRFEAVTRDSRVDNLRPIVPRGAPRGLLLWLRGTYRAYTDYALEAVGLLPR